MDYLHNTIVKSGAAPKLAAAPPAMEMPQHKQHSSIFAPQKHSLFSWARSFVEPKAKVQHKEQHAHQGYSEYTLNTSIRSTWTSNVPPTDCT